MSTSVGGTSPTMGSIAEPGMSGTVDAYGAIGSIAMEKASSSNRLTGGSSRSYGESIDVGASHLRFPLGARREECPQLGLTYSKPIAENTSAYEDRIRPGLG